MASPSSSTQVSFTVAFYDPATQAADGEDRTLPEILAFSDSDLEYHHDFIQYLFPLPERSPINPYAPVINAATRQAFLERPELRQQLFRSLARMARFYGFEVSVSAHTETVGSSDNNNGDETVQTFLRPSSNPQKWSRNSRLWLTRFSHNHLRITRMIRCLRVLGMEALAHGFHQTLLYNDPEDRISARTKMFWERAARRRLHLAPEEEDEEVRGVVLLREEGGAEGENGETEGRNGETEGADDGFDAQTGRMAVLSRNEVGEA